MENALDNTIFGDIAQIEKTLSEDVTGDHARSMLKYFDEVTQSTRAMLEKPLSDSERELVDKLIEGFGASQRIVRHVWETLHSAVLPA